MTESLYDLLDPYGAADPVDGALWAALNLNDLAGALGPRWQAAWLDPDLDHGALAAAQAAINLAMTALSQPQWRRDLEQRAEDGQPWLCDGEQDSAPDPSAAALEQLAREEVVAAVYGDFAGRITAASRASASPAELRAVRAERERALRAALREAGFLPALGTSSTRSFPPTAIAEALRSAAWLGAAPLVTVAVTQAARAAGDPTAAARWIDGAPPTFWACATAAVVAAAGWRAASPGKSATRRHASRRAHRLRWPVRAWLVWIVSVAVATAPAVAAALAVVPAAPLLLAPRVRRRIRQALAGTAPALHAAELLPGPAAKRLSTRRAAGATAGDPRPPSPSDLPARTRFGDPALDLSAATATLRNLAKLAGLPDQDPAPRDMITAVVVAEAWSAACREPDPVCAGLYGPQAVRILSRAVARSAGYAPSAVDVPARAERGPRPAWAADEARALGRWARGQIGAAEAASALRRAAAELRPRRGPGLPAAVADRLELLALAVAREAGRR